MSPAAPRARSESGTASARSQRLQARPDPAAIARALAAPERGPRVVFLSGGSALRGLSRALTRYSHNCAHLITPFDSGGSSAPLRAAFSMPAVGDLRNRLLAIAGKDARALSRALQHRLPYGASREALANRLRALSDGEDPLLSDLAASERRSVERQLQRVREALPDDFDLRGASIGNLALVGSYLANASIDDAVDEVGAMLQAQGIVLPTTDADLHLAARLEDGRLVVGQHRITGKQHPPLQSRIEELFLVSPGDTRAEAVRPAATPRALEQIRRADLICYPMGSFYSSVLCNTLPKGIGSAIAGASCLKIYIPSTGRDPELLDTPIAQAAALLTEALSRDTGPLSAGSLLGGVLLDENPDVYPTPPDLPALQALGVETASAELVSAGSLPDIDSDRLAQLLVSLARGERDNPQEPT